jgi:hypothetical protein
MALRKEAPLFRCRCSALGQLMTPARSKSETLSETAKTMLVTWYKEKLYNRRKEIQSKYLTKGNLCEDDSIAYINQLYGTDYRKNEQYFNSEYINGTPDILTEDTVLDIKSSWSFDTFPLFSSNLPSKDYFAQVQGYMHLTGKKKGSVIYVLMDTPDELIEKEWRSAGGTGLVTPEFKANYKYTDISSELRVKRFDFDYDADFIGQVVDKVEMARNFINSLRY